MKTINCKGKLIDLTTPKIMGIVNRTPDSFYDGGQLKSDKDVLLQVESMLKEGATFLDIGGYSSRPDATEVPEDEELQRVVSTVSVILKKFPKTLISIDTFRSRVAEEAISCGAAIINDISAGVLDAKMLGIVSKHQVPYVMMHMRGTPKTMQQHTEYNNLTQDVFDYFSERIAEARSHKINDLIIDPGFGFAKTQQQNYRLFDDLEYFKTFDLPLLVGISRKSMIYKLLGTNPQEALNGTTALHAIALLKGAAILRVHDVKEAEECIKLVRALKS